ncbi:vomeronasal type-1 receptor 4-like [Mustela nigripes]|uniref:vomeronasal type-1 receptor 4-like n=1 Tax=Mustela nigripes TaxID=77151 RepID=UPI0028152671|nr:vomeronasal type-1 receptor 4-like [Mustela nigripes]
MASRDLAIATIYLSQTTVGILGNFSLPFHDLCHYYTEGRLRPTGSLLKHLIIANSLLMLSKGVPQTSAALGLKYFYHDLGLRLLLYIHRMGREVCISNICLLSIFQNIMISPMNSCWKDFKVKAPEYVSFSISLCWIMHIMVNFIMPMYVLYISGKQSSRKVTKKKDFGVCSTSSYETTAGLIFIALVVFPEASFCVLTIWASGSMVFFLHRHRQRVQHIHRPNNVSPRFSAESRTTQSTLALVTTFVSFSFLFSIFQVGAVFIYNPNWWLVKTSDLSSMCFPVARPFMLRSRDSTVTRVCFVRTRNTKSPILTRKI